MNNMPGPTPGSTGTLPKPDALTATRSSRPGLLLQRLVFDRPPSLRPLYVRTRGEAPQGSVMTDAGELCLPDGETLSFDTYFNAFFEHQWRDTTRLQAITLEIEARGDIALRVVRRLPEGRAVTLAERCVRGLDGTFRLALPPPPSHPRAAGRLFLELTALRPGARLRSAGWYSPDTAPKPVGLVLVFCTFNREADLARVLASIAADTSALDALSRIVVVSQGRPRLDRHPAIAALPLRLRNRLEVIEQANFGGVGGFTRGMLAARDCPGATHVMLMDDDVVVEPESLRRAAAFFSIARPGLALGGQMLDLLQPTRLYEAGARIHPGSWALEPLRFHLPLDRRRGLDSLQQPEALHYNGWWMFGLPLSMVDEAGLPLPCFIRGDDVEYGRRLHDRGMFTVSLPGIAVWHEPFYLRLGSWQLYYETRNMLIAAALHFPRSGRGLAVLLIKRLLGQLLTYRYYSAALLLRAAEDYLQGPAILETPPWVLHASLDEEKARFPTATVDAARVAQPARIPADPAGRVRFLIRLARAMLRNALRRVPAAPPPVKVPMRDLLWFRVTDHDLVVAETGWEARNPAFQRDPVAFRQLLGQGLRLALRLARQAGSSETAWRQAQPRFVSPAFWRSYLRLAPVVPEAPAQRPGYALEKI